MSSSDTDPAVVDVEWIAARIGDPDMRLVEVDVGPAAYNEGHIPGAVLWNAYSDLRDESYQPVGSSELQSLLSNSGIALETTVVFYGYSGPLGFWLLKALGHQDARILEGPRDQWANAGREWSTDIPEPPQSDYPQVIEGPELLATRETVQAAIDDANQVLLDVRSEAEFNGERFWPSGATADAGRAGRLPGAVNIPIDLLRAEDQTLRSPEELQRVFEQAGLTKEKSVITYCTIGNRASQAWFALTQLLGYRDVRVYYGSWVEWGKATDTAVET